MTIKLKQDAQSEINVINIEYETYNNTPQQMVT